MRLYSRAALIVQNEGMFWNHPHRVEDYEPYSPGGTPGIDPTLTAAGFMRMLAKQGWT